MTELDTPTLRRELSKNYTAQVRKHLGGKAFADLIARAGDADRESRCAAERYDAPTGEFIRKAWVDVTGASVKVGEINLDELVNRSPIRSHMSGAIELAKMTAYWTKPDGFE